MEDNLSESSSLLAQLPLLRYSIFILVKSIFSKFYTIIYFSPLLLLLHLGMLSFHANWLTRRLPVNGSVTENQSLKMTGSNRLRKAPSDLSLSRWATLMLETTNSELRVRPSQRPPFLPLLAVLRSLSELPRSQLTKETLLPSPLWYLEHTVFCFNLLHATLEV